MYRSHFFAVLVLTVATIGPQSATYAQNDPYWKQRQDRMELSRREFAQRYQNWVSEQDQRNQTWRDARGTDKDRVLELSDPGLKPGQYTVRLPFGLGVRVNVPDENRTATAAGAWGDRSYGDVHHRTRQLTTQLRDLHHDLRRLGHADITAEVAKIYEQSAALTEAAATRRPATEIREQFVAFDTLWHPLSHRIERMENIGSSVQQRVASIDQMEEALHQILAIAPAAPYNRPLVAALTGELVQTTSHLLDDLKLERQTADLHALTLRAQRVKQNAVDFDATVRQNASFATIIEEYEEFDRAWHRLNEQSRISPEVDSHIRKVARQVREIDSQLHQELYVNVPIASGRQQLLQISAGIAKEADYLAEELDAETGRGKRDLLNDARIFAASARELQRALGERSSPQAEQRALNHLTESGLHLERQIKALQGERFDHAQAIAAQLAIDVKRLRAQWPK